MVTNSAPDLSVRIGSLTLKNPVMPASGTIAEGMTQVIDMGRLGAIVLKTITPDLRQGTLPPRVAEYRDATLFSIGIPSKGPDYLLEHTLPAYAACDAPLVASVSADTAEDFGKLAAYISDPRIAAIEANISCPNLKADGRAFGMDPEATREVLERMVAATRIPVWAKLTPNVGDITVFARVAEEAGCEAVIVGNAILGMAVDAEAMRPRLGNVMGGLTGPAVKPILLRMVHQCAKAVQIPVIGCGGITGGEDAVEYMLAGATAVQVGTANFIRPHTMTEAVDWIADYCTRHGLSAAREITGALRPLHAPATAPTETV
ncbi:dihydroorotate dehydrogenase [Oceanicella sp. SM1341]|uniref:dihydroorotate dehydrogenase n=1 Tax=Oceanicella sp. SM1341 TaxID=1548889 RepID=UPI000E536423|nr:dihydroorotate dehydrogenase [Oceanicella sp. SM1341]